MRTVISDTCDRTQILYILSEHAAEYREQGDGLALLSVIILSPDGYATVQALMRCLKKQSLRKELELVFVVPVGTVESLDAVDARDFATVKKIEVEDMKRSAHARAAGIRAATSPVVVLTEDHSRPEPEWAESLVRAHQGDWAVVGPAVQNGNPGSSLSWANFLIEYSEWLYPTPGGVLHHLPGHNSSYKIAALRPYWKDLENWLEAESVLHWELEKRGQRLYLEPSARTLHLNFSRFRSSLTLRFHAGRLFAGMRCLKWEKGRRVLYAGLFIFIPLVRFARIWRNMMQWGRPLSRAFAATPWMLPLLFADAVGEMTGYLFGPKDSADYITRIDFHREQFMNRKDRAQLADFLP